MRKAKAQAMTTPMDQAAIIRELAVIACTDGANSFDTVHWYFMQLANLFSAIKALDPDKYSNASMLAELGEHLSNDWAGFVECSKDALQKHSDEIKTVALNSEVGS